jgi:hypothetical protein
MIQTASCSIGSLFTGTVHSRQEDGSEVEIAGRLNIPEYQRPYLWGKKDVDKLIRDLKEHFSGDLAGRPDFYLGSIILHRQGRLLNVIDGQQRLTTIALLLKAAGVSDHVPVIDFTSPSSTQQIRNNYKYLCSSVSELKSLHDLSERINVTLVVTDREDDAYTFFETQNTGGVRLGGVDIIKAYHLRAITDKAPRSNAAIKWERKSELKEVVKLLLKARYWKYYKPVEAPKRNNKTGLKNAIVDEFSEKTRKNSLADYGFALSRLQQDADGWKGDIPAFPFSIRQPLNDGENLIDYIVSFCSLYSEVLPYKKGKWEDKSYESFINRVIKPVDGTLFLKELFEISLLSYAHRFGTAKLYEAALWIFRCAYELRLSNEKTVKETSVPSFLDKLPLIDIILNAFDHPQLMLELREFPAKVNPENLTGDTVKCRYLGRLKDFFKIDFHVDAELIDNRLKQAINSTIQSQP